MQSGALIAAMMSYLQSMHRHIKKESLWVLSNLTAGQTRHTDALIQAGMLPPIVDLMSSTYDIKKEVCSMSLIFLFSPVCLYVSLYFQEAPLTTYMLVRYLHFMYPGTLTCCRANVAI